MQSVGEKLTEHSVEIHSLLTGACENVQNRCAIQRIITDIKKQKVKAKGNEQQVACLEECVVKVETELQKTHDDILELRHERAVRPGEGGQEESRSEHPTEVGQWAHHVIFQHVNSDDSFAKIKRSNINTREPGQQSCDAS